MGKYDLILHVDKPDGSINIAFNNAVNYVKALPGEHFEMILLLNSKAAGLMARGAEGVNAEKLENALAAGLKIKVCRNALNEHHIDAASLHPACEIVPAGMVEIVERQRAGYAYVKP